VTAQYTINSYTLTYTAGTGGSLTGLTTQSVNYGSNGTAVEAVADSGYAFVKWSDNSTDNPRTDINISGNITVEAQFGIQYTLIYNSGDNGYINMIGSTSTTQLVFASYNGTEVLAIPADGYKFVKWSDESTNNPRTDTNVLNNINVTAQFELVCPDSTVLYDGVTYNTVAIGEQCWFKENLAYLPMVHNNSDYVASSTAGLPGYGVYGYDGSDLTTAKSQANYSTYGVLYNWYAVDQVNICPTGWHVPTDAEFTILTDWLVNYGGIESGYEGTALKASVWDGNNSSGFTALPADSRFDDGDFYDLGDFAYFWSSSGHGSGFSWSRSLGSGDARVYRGSGSQSLGFSVRCLRTE
ncbi:MAG: FISUMP domain-containing protein, partial [Acholeplasmataceae bacterium]